MVEKRRMEGLGEVDVERRWRGMEGRARALLEPSTACFRGKYEFGMIQGGVVVLRNDTKLAGGSSRWACRVSTGLIHYAYIFISNRHIFYMLARPSTTEINLPTNQDHRPILHVLQLPHARMLLLLPLHRNANDFQQLSLPFAIS